MLYRDEISNGNVLGVSRNFTLCDVDGRKTRYQFAEGDVELMLLGFDVQVLEWEDIILHN